MNRPRPESATYTARPIPVAEPSSLFTLEER